MYNNRGKNFVQLVHEIYKDSALTCKAFETLLRYDFDTSYVTPAQMTYLSEGGGMVNCYAKLNIGYLHSFGTKHNLVAKRSLKIADA
jgi:hypothetical protein